jgi:hypothetical protein
MPSSWPENDQNLRCNWFEPILAHSIGGVPVSAKKSPVRRHDDSKKGRQIDCIANKKAYEFKIRVTIAASGQGRWQEELDFPLDCRKSGFTPVLVVFDPTENPKLDALQKAFKAQRGEVYVGEAAWKHLDQAAGSTMAVFIDRYVKNPINSLLAEVVNGELPDLRLAMTQTRFTVTVAGQSFSHPRKTPDPELEVDAKTIPDDVMDE